jgi:molecular chaperone DnaK (HSP70)
MVSLEDFFGRPMSKTCDGDESVARGAAWMCAMLSPTVKLATVFEVKDINIYPITIQWGPLEAGRSTQDAPSMTMPAGAVSSPPATTLAGGVAAGTTDPDCEQLFSSAQHFPHLKIISFTDRKEPFQLSAYYSDPSQLPAG